MFQSLDTGHRNNIMNLKVFTTLILLVATVALSGCISKTKVYTADKTLVFGSSIYNLSNVKRLGSRIEGTLPDGSKIDLERADKSEINDLLRVHSSFVVSTYIEMDDKALTYQRSEVDRYSDFSKLVKNQNSAMNKISKFMANKKSTQLKLK